MIGENKFIRVSVAYEIPYERLSGLLSCALEGGSNYWYKIVGSGAGKADFQYYPDKRFSHIDNPLSTYGFLNIADREDETQAGHVLNLETIHRGLSLMAEKYPSHFQDFINDNDDAETGDVFLQLCLFGEIIYG